MAAENEDDFDFDLNAMRIRIPNRELLSSLEKYANRIGCRYFTTTEYDHWPGKRCYSGTISKRFGSWRKALAQIGIHGGRERCYTSEELIENLDSVWRELGYPPGKRAIASRGKHISEKPYKDRWGSLKRACQLLAEYRRGRISRQKLLQGNPQHDKRETVPARIRFAVLKRDNRTCVVCGASREKNRDVVLEVDHIKPVAKGGTNEMENLQTLCRKCNQGKKDD